MIPTFHGRPRVAQLVTALKALNPSAQQYILVDDGSSDNSFQQFCLACEEDERFLVLTQPNRGPAAARNRGIQAAVGEWVAFTDDDCIPSPGWLGELWKCRQQNPEAQAVFGCIRATGSKSYFSHYVENSGEGHQTANAMYRREALHQVGGFDERFRTPYLEDTDLFLSIQALGPSVFAELALVEHPVRPAGVTSRVKRMRYYVSDFLLFQKHPEHYRKRHRGLGPGPYLAYYVGFKHGLALLWSHLPALLNHPMEYGKLVWTLLLERVYLAYLLRKWLRSSDSSGRSFVAKR